MMRREGKKMNPHLGGATLDLICFTLLLMDISD